MTDSEFENNIIIFRNGALGDFVLTLPVFQAIQEYFPSYQLYAIGRPTNCSMLTKSWGVIDSESRNWGGLYNDGSLPKHIENLLAKTTLALIYSKPYGNLFRNAKNLLGNKAFFFDPQPPINYSGHITDHLLSPLTKTLKIPVLNRSPISPISKKQICKIDVVAHVGSSSPKKNWPLENFITLAKNLQQQGIKVSLIQGPIEKEMGITESTDIPIGCPQSLEELACFLASAKLFVGNDSGPGHLAAAVGTATLTLFGPTDPQVWAPRHPKSQILSEPNKSMKNISVDSVISATLKQLSD
ncbi:MAG: glycosyltransferase family 9 protein [Candidatus Latescibacterota bacterium]|nr:glycosyltransferase family 9 protein [Candidatus Latescibacterota bacterium]